VRQRFEERFTTARMAKDYVSTYRQLLKMRRSNGKTQSQRSRATRSQWRQWPSSRFDGKTDSRAVRDQRSYLKISPVLNGLQLRKKGNQRG
jgi:hypothetical protein